MSVPRRRVKAKPLPTAKPEEAMPMNDELILAIDAGTTGIHVALYDRNARIVAGAYQDFTQLYPRPGWVEHDPEEIWKVTLRLLRKVCFGQGRIRCIGITNQRETTVVWDRKTGKPAANAIVWQCRRSQPQCERLKTGGCEQLVREKTGLVIDAYFSGTKVQWLLENVPDLRSQAENGELAFGTIDSWLAWNLTRGRLHVTDYTNASRTLLFNIEEKRWDSSLLDLMQVPPSMLPDVLPSAYMYGEIDEDVFGQEAMLAALAGDQQAALVGQGGVDQGDAKNTYGTGCFFLVNTGKNRIKSNFGLLTTLACDRDGKPVFALEGSVFIAGAAIQWLRDELGLIENSAESEDLALQVEDTGGVYLVPAFAGLGAPYWDMQARGALLGITRGTNKRHVVRAALESIAYQCADLIAAAERDTGIELVELRVDGGATANNFLMQFQADILGVPVNRPRDIETTALGAAFLAGLATGFWQSWDELASNREIDRVFYPKMKDEQRRKLLSGWREAVARVSTQGRALSRQ